MSFPDLSSLRSLLCIHFTRNKDAWAACDEWVAARERRLSVWLISAHFTSIINECSNRMKRKTFHLFTTLFSFSAASSRLYIFYPLAHNETMGKSGGNSRALVAPCCTPVGWVFAPTRRFVLIAATSQHSRALATVWCWWDLNWEFTSSLRLAPFARLQLLLCEFKLFNWQFHVLTS